MSLRSRRNQLHRQFRSCMLDKFSTVTTLGIGNALLTGLDVLLTRPDTEGSIQRSSTRPNDNINEIGAYLQSETKIIPQLKFIAAGRIDDHNQLEDVRDFPTCRGCISTQRRP